MTDDRLTLREAASVTGLTREDVVELIANGHVEAERGGNRWRINPDSLPDPPMPQTHHRPIILRGSKDGWLPGSVSCGDRAPRQHLPPDPPPPLAPWRIIQPGCVKDT